MPSLLELQSKAVCDAISNVQPQNTWRYVVADETSYKLMMNVLDIDRILSHKVTAVQQLEHKRPSVPKFEAVYFVAPEEFSVQCLISDYTRKVPRYGRGHIYWISEPGENLRGMIRNSPAANYVDPRGMVLSIDFYPRESHLFTFREPSSFFTLYHPECRGVVRSHLVELARKIVSVCVTLGEYPTVRYFRPPNLMHEARVLSELLAKTVQEELDYYIQANPRFPPQSDKPKAVLFIVDRSMDLYAPFLHEFTYQAMAFDLLPIQDGDKVVYKTEVVENGKKEVKEMVISEDDKIWVDVRHQHMKDTIEKLMADFDRFLKENKNFVNSESATSLNAIRDMVANLPQFQEMKEAYSLHLSMAQECMNLFDSRKLPDTASVEQTLATGLNENYQPPKNIADQLVRILDDPAIGHPDRLRLIIIYLLYKDGLLKGDVDKLLAHSQLGPMEKTIIENLTLLGARVYKQLKDTSNRNTSQKKKQGQSNDTETYELSRFVTALKTMLEDHVKGTLDPNVFPFVKPELANPGLGAQENTSQASLRSAKPTWAKTRLSVVEPKQRVIVFMAGGATYSESRACYEISKASLRDVFFGHFAHDNSNVLPQPLVPKHLLEEDPIPKPAPPPAASQKPKLTPAPTPQPPTKEMAAMKVQYNPPGGGRYAPEEKKKKKFGLF
ncbi:Sec1-like protein [Kalaharituber pfeilii]|nr:Sec1-like protein [Kalaharituber pfeilii]